MRVGKAHDSKSPNQQAGFFPGRGVGIESDHRSRCFVVAIYPAGFHFAEDPVPTGSYNESWLKDRRSALVQTMKEQNASAANAATEVGLTVLREGAAAPFVVASGAGAQIMALFHSPLVTFVESANADVRPFFETASQNVWLHDLYNANFSGNGEVVAVIEPPPVPGSAMTWNHQFIAPSAPGGDQSTLSPGCTIFDDPNDQAFEYLRSHATMVAGLISGIRPTPLARSGAFGARVVSGNTCDPSIPSATYPEAALWGAQTHSWTMSSGLSTQRQRLSTTATGRLSSTITCLRQPVFKALDSRSRWARTFEVHACGNSGDNMAQPGPRNQIVACSEYNSLKVGGFDVGFSPSWDDDQRYKGNFRNPLISTDGINVVQGDRELPELVGPADNLDLITEHNLTGFSAYFGGVGGTSAAAPLIAGLGAVMQGYQPRLRYWPEAVRATLMAGAVHREFGNVPYAAPDFGQDKIGGARATLPDGWLGAGSPSAKAARQMLDGTRGSVDLLSLTPNDFDGNRTHSRRWSLNRSLGRRVQVALAWSSVLCPVTGCETGNHSFTIAGAADTLATDFDLVVVNRTTGVPIRIDALGREAPNGVVLGSLSFDNSYEFISINLDAINTADLDIQLRFYGDAMHPYEPASIAIYYYEDEATEGP